MCVRACECACVCVSECVTSVDKTSDISGFKLSSESRVRQEITISSLSSYAASYFKLHALNYYYLLIKCSF